jgi:hypothetical protein
MKSGWMDGQKPLEQIRNMGNRRSFVKRRYMPNFVSVRGGLEDLLCLRVRREHAIIWPHQKSALSTMQQMTHGTTHSSIATWQGRFGPLRMMMFFEYLLANGTDDPKLWLMSFCDNLSQAKFILL